MEVLLGTLVKPSTATSNTSSGGGGGVGSVQESSASALEAEVCNDFAFSHTQRHLHTPIHNPRRQHDPHTRSPTHMFQCIN
jgi:hypothetical protein